MRTWRQSTRCLATVALGLLAGGCGVPLGPVDKLPTTSLGEAPRGGLSGLGDNAFTPLFTRVVRINTGEQDQAPTPADRTRRGLAGTCLLGGSFTLTLTAGAAVQVVVAAPERSDLVLRFRFNGVDQRIDQDPLSPNLSVESFVATTEVATSVQIQAANFNTQPLPGQVRWYAFLLPSSGGRVGSEQAAGGAAGTTTLPGSFTFDALARGRRYEVIAIGPAGSDLVLRPRIGRDQYRVDADPQAPDRRLEGFTLEVDDPATVEVEVADFTDQTVPGDVRWAVILLPGDGRDSRPEDQLAPLREPAPSSLAPTRAKPANG